MCAWRFPIPGLPPNSPRQGDHLTIETYDEDWGSTSQKAPALMACQDVRGKNEAVNVTLGKLNEIFIRFKWVLTVTFSMDFKGIWWNASWL